MPLVRAAANEIRYRLCTHPIDDAYTTCDPPPENKTARTHFESGLHCPKNPDPGKPAFCCGSILVLKGGGGNELRCSSFASPPHDRPVSTSRRNLHNTDRVIHKKRRCRKLIPQRLCFYVCYYTRKTWKVKHYCIRLYTFVLLRFPIIPDQVSPKARHSGK